MEKDLLSGLMLNFQGKPIDLHRLVAMDIKFAQGIDWTRAYDGVYPEEVIIIHYFYELKQNPVVQSLYMGGEHNPVDPKSKLMSYIHKEMEDQIITKIDGRVYLGLGPRTGGFKFASWELLTDIESLHHTLLWKRIHYLFMEDFRKWQQWKADFNAFKIDNHI